MQLLAEVQSKFIFFTISSMGDGLKYYIGLLCRDDDGTPVTARRWLSLVTVNGDDDMFSSDFTAAQLQVRPHTSLYGNK